MASERKEKAQSFARVTVTLDIAVSDTWGDDCTVGQVYKQAKESAMNVLRKAFSPQDMASGAITIVGEPQARMIVRPEKET